MKIVYCIPFVSSSGGVERVTSIKANWLVEHGHEVHVICKEKWSSSFFPYDSRVVFHSIGSPSLHQSPSFIRICERTRFLNPIVALRRRCIWARDRKAYLDIFERIKPDIILAQSGDIILTGVMLKYRDAYGKNKVRLVLESHAYRYAQEIIDGNTSSSYSSRVVPISFWDSMRRRFGAKIIEQTEEDQINSVDVFVTLTHEDAQNYDGINVRVIPNPITIDPILSDSDVELIRFRSREKRLIAVGRCDRQKNLEALVRVWRILSPKYPDWSLSIFGSQVSELLSSEIKGLERVFLNPPTREIRDEMLRSSIYVMTSRYEGLPLVLIESQALGLPIVSFSCPCGPKDVVSDGIDGFLAEPNDEQVLISKLEILMSDDNLRNWMSCNALESSKRYDVDTVMGQWINLFDMIRQ